MATTNVTIQLTVAALVLLWGHAAAHSWLECTDYRVTPGSDDTKVWNKAACFGNARCGQRQAQEGFGHDTGFNYHSAAGCQCARGSSYDGIAKAVYTPGQRVCLAHPSKNHVAAPCSNAFIPDAGTTITRSHAGAGSDDDVARTYTDADGAHTSGQVDYKGFQNCPNFCSDMDKSLCTVCFDLEPDLAPGEYTFRWVWSFNSGDDAYTTCWEAEVRGGSGYNRNTPTAASAAAVSFAKVAPEGDMGKVHAADAATAPTETPVVSTATPTPSAGANGDYPTDEATEEDEEYLDCEEDETSLPPSASDGDYELDCDEDPPTPGDDAVGGDDDTNGDEEDDCPPPLPMATASSGTLEAVEAETTAAPPTETPTRSANEGSNRPSDPVTVESGEPRVGLVQPPKQEEGEYDAGDNDNRDDCGVAPDEPETRTGDDGPGVVQASPLE